MLADSRSAGTMNWWIVGRLRTGATPASVTAELKALHTRTRADSPQWFREADLFAASIRKDASGREPFEATLARWLGGVAAIILLVAVANVVSLLLARLARRRRELALRVALGSGRGRVVRLISLEGALLVCAGGLFSLWIARLSEPVFRRLLFADEATWTFTLLDLRLLGAVAALVVVTAAVVGLAPAIQTRQRNIESALRAGSQGGGSGNPRVRAVLTVVQAMLSVTLLVGAGLFIRSLARVDAIDLGVDRDRLITATAELPPPTHFTSDGLARYQAREMAVYRRLAEAVTQLADVERAAVAVGRPLDGGTFSAAVYVDGDSVVTLPTGGPWASVVGPGYFETAGTDLLGGRTFTERDRAGSEPVLVVGLTMAERLWPGEDPIGACVRLVRADTPCYRVVGIVEDVHRVGLREEPSLQYYIPIGQESMFGGATLLIRTDPSQTMAWPELRQTILAVDPAIRYVELQWLRQSVDAETRPLRLGLLTFGLSGGLALLVAILGLYSLMSYMVAWRTREIGVRMAIGATRPQITRLVIGGAAGLAAIGVGLGLIVSFWAGRWVQPHLFETSGADPIVFAGVALILLAVAVLAGLVPALRALSISPVEALRAD
jgi:predicted permease